MRLFDEKLEDVGTMLLNNTCELGREVQAGNENGYAGTSLRVRPTGCVDIIENGPECAVATEIIPCFQRRIAPIVV